VINDNMINEINRIVEHVCVVISRFHGCKDTTYLNEKIIYILRV
jgi:hypothetical protein